MLDTLGNLALGFSVALSPPILFYAFVGCVVGTLVGVLPGVGPLAGISLLLPATFGLDCVYVVEMPVPYRSRWSVAVQRPTIRTEDTISSKPNTRRRNISTAR